MRILLAFILCFDAKLGKNGQNIKKYLKKFARFKNSA